MTDYFSKLDEYLGPGEENRFLDGASEQKGMLGKPITSIKKLGTTFAEKPNGQQANVLGSLISSIRQGTGTLQLAIQTPTNQQVGGGVSSIGKSKRQAIKEVIKASGVEWEGIEMPTSNMSNMSGFDPQRGGFSEQKRADDIRHVKDAINFAAEIGAGGSIDVWSQEFSRNIATASFHKQDSTEFIDFEGFDENVDEIRTLVDERTGQAVQLSSRQLGGQGNPLISVPKWKKDEQGRYVDAEGNPLQADSDNQDFIMSRVPEWDPEKERFESEQMDWKRFKQYAEQRNQEEGVKRTPEEWWQRIQLENQYAQQRAQAIYHTQRYQKEKDELEKPLEARQMYEKLEGELDQDELIKRGLLVPSRPGTGMRESSQFLPSEYKKKSEIIQESINDIKRSMKHTHESSGLADAQAQAVWENIQHVKPVEEYAKEKTTNSYADLAIYAMEQTKKHNPTKPISVGPELGWPQGYGGHTEEFIDIIKGSRQQMVEKMKKDPKYRARYNNQQLKEMAKQHIAGVLDTSHLSMWYNHFPEKKGESEEKRLKRFNNWYLKQMDRLAEEEVVGSVQIVDSATGDHRHLPPGEGIFPTVDAVKRLKEKGWDGAVLSEGHEDEAMEPGKIQYSLWNAFGASMGTDYHFGAPRGGNSFGNVYTGAGGAAGYRAPPNYIVGGYAPSNEWKLWSEVPLE